MSKGLKRNTIDKFYTKKEIAAACLNYVKKYITIGQNDLIIEPSAGDGAFLEGVGMFGCDAAFYDIEPAHANIIQQDYLLLGAPDKKYNKVHIIGNPPFGRQSSMAIKFIQKSCEFCESLSFILPKSFKKESMRKKIPPLYHLLFEIDLPAKSFLVEGEEHTVETVFQIWQRRDLARVAEVRKIPVGYIFVGKGDKPDIYFRRVGANAGNIGTKYEDKSEQSHYFIKFTNNLPVAENIKKIMTAVYKFNNTVGPRSISKQELIAQFNLVLG